MTGIWQLQFRQPLILPGSQDQLEELKFKPLNLFAASAKGASELKIY